MDNEEKYMIECEIIEWCSGEKINPMTVEEIAAIEKEYEIPSSQVPVPNMSYDYTATEQAVQDIGIEKWKQMLKGAEKHSLDSDLSKVVNHKDVNDAYEALRKITNKDNAVGALSVILAERLERLISKKQ